MRRRAPARGRVFKRRFPRRRANRGAGKIYSFKRQYDVADILVPANTAVLGFASAYTLSTVPNVAEFTTLYDNYRIMAVKETFWPPFNTFQSANTNAVPEIYTVLDFDSSTIPTTLDDLNQYQTLQRKFFTRPHSRFLKPRAAQQGLATSAGTFTGALQVKRSAWMDCNFTNINYYGLRGAAVCAEPNPNDYRIRRTVTVYMQFRNVR